MKRYVLLSALFVTHAFAGSLMQDASQDSVMDRAFQSLLKENQISSTMYAGLKKGTSMQGFDNGTIRLYNNVQKSQKSTLPLAMTLIFNRNNKTAKGVLYPEESCQGIVIGNVSDSERKILDTKGLGIYRNFNYDRCWD